MSEASIIVLGDRVTAGPLEGQLARAGYRVRAASPPTITVGVDLVIIDGASAAAVSETLQTLPLAASVLVLSPTIDAAMIARSPTSHYLLKPCSDRDLAAGVELAIARSRASRRRTQQLLAQMFEASPDGVLAVAAGGTITHANARVAAMFGYERHELIGQPLELLVATEVRATHVQHRAAYAEAPRCRAMGLGQTVFEGRRKDGTPVPLAISLGPLDVDGARETVAHLCDLSIVAGARRDAQLRGEQVLQRAASDHAAWQRLEAQHLSAVGQLTGRIGHDLNNTLAVIQTTGDLLTYGLPDGDPRRDDVDQITRAAQHAADLTRQLLEFSRRQVLQRPVHDLRKLVRDHESSLRRLVGHHVLTLTLPDVPVHACVDAGQFAQVLFDLVLHARDAMSSSGAITIEISEVEVEAPRPLATSVLDVGRYARFAILDTRDVVELAPERVAVGAGLEVVRGAVVDNGGGLDVHAEPGRGTQVVIYLPQRNAAVPGARRPS